MIRVLLADSQNLFRKGFSAILNEEDKIIVVGLAEDGNDLIRKHKQTKPDLIITEIYLPIKSGIDAIKKIRRMDKNIKVLFLSTYSWDDYIYSVIKSGAQGFLTKDADLDELRLAISEVIKGNFYCLGRSNSELEAIQKRVEVRKVTGKGETNLTKREEEILLLISKSKTTNEIASKLKLSPRTIEGHRYSIIKKFKLNSLGGLINFAIEYSNRVKSKKGIMYN